MTVQEAWQGGEVAARQRAAKLLLHKLLPRRAGAARERGQILQVAGGERPDLHLIAVHAMCGMPGGT